MDHRKLRRRLRNLAKQADARWPTLNRGGCCVFAAAVATELERLGVKHEVIVPGTKYTDLNELRPDNNTVSGWNDMGVGFSHVGVRLKLNGQWYTYDSEAPLVPGKYKFGIGYHGEPYTAAKGGLTATEATDLADERHSWNWEFPRQAVPFIRQFVKDMLT